MAQWFRGSISATLVTVGVHDNNEEAQLHNQSTDIFDASDLVIVDGFLTLITDTDDLCGFRFVRQREDLLTGDLNENLPPEGDPAIWYSMFHGRGPVTYRLRSKFTIYPEYKIWTTMWKERGANSTVFSAGWRLLVVKK